MANWQERLAPIGESNAGWLSYLYGLWGVVPKNEARGAGTGLDMNRSLFVGRAELKGKDQQRSIVAQSLFPQGRRGSMSAIPTPQALIRQVTGIGATPEGR